MRKPSHIRRPAFTLVEMLVVIGIIVVLVALLVPAAAIAVSRVRNFNMTAEISQFATAIEAYKKDKGDYPPCLSEIDNSGNSLYLPATRYNTIVERHLRKCYPKMTNGEKDFFYDNIALDPNGNNRLTGDEALVFWLTMAQNDERNPFTSRAGAPAQTSGPITEPTRPGGKKYYDFKDDRLIDFDGDYITWQDADGAYRRLDFYSYKPNYAKETAYIYLDSRTYLVHQLQSTALGGNVQAYGDFNRANEILAKNQSNPPPAGNQAEINQRKQYQYMNQTTFQIICAGQDGEFGRAFNQFDNISNATGLKTFTSGTNYTDEDKDNLTNFSEGRRLEDHIP